MTEQITDWEWVREMAKAKFVDVPDVVRYDEDGNQEWLYLSHHAGVDEDGFYRRVTVGPAEGEKVYDD